jgi:hypothetical protein
MCVGRGMAVLVLRSAKEKSFCGVDEGARKNVGGGACIVRWLSSYLGLADKNS